MVIAFRALRSAAYVALTVADVAVRTYDRAARIGRALLPRRREDAPSTRRSRT